MTAETVISSVAALVCIAPVIIIGIVQYRSKEPVGFWSGKKPPRKEQITDVKEYNRKHGLMWIALGVGFLLCFGCGILIGGLAAGYLCMIEVMGGIAAMVVRHGKLDRMYRKRMEMSRRVLKYVICTISEMFHHPFGIFPAAETMRNDTMPERTGEK